MTIPRLAPRAHVVLAWALLAVGSLSCGGTATHHDQADAGAGGGPAPDASIGGTTAGSGGATGATGGRTGSGGRTGAAGGGGGGGAGADGVPAVDVSGRWGLFVFEDPVGVRLIQGADGRLTGEGCAAGAPGSTDPAEPGIPASCGSIVGKVDGRGVWFGFQLRDFAFWYVTHALASKDAQRLGGILSTNGAEFQYPVAWRRVRDDADWLDRGKLSRPEPMAGSYDLTLIPAESAGSEFDASHTYRIRYQDHTIAGHLGSFWTDELSPLSEGSPLRVGPVAATSPALPTALLIDFDKSGFTRLTATTPSGGRYRFSMRPVAP
jgi:hypothetical protein